MTDTITESRVLPTEVRGSVESKQEVPKPVLTEEKKQWLSGLREKLKHVFDKSEKEDPARDVLKEVGGVSGELENFAGKERQTKPQIEITTEALREPQPDKQDAMEGAYSPNQRDYIDKHFGFKIKDGMVLIVRAQATLELPTGVRSTSLIVPEQNSFYGPTGYIIELPFKDIPWVSDGDAGTPRTSNNIPRPEGSMSLSEYLRNDVRSGKYNETVIDFGTGKPNNVRAVFDFREIPSEPGFVTRIVNPKKNHEIKSERDYIKITREGWSKKAQELGVPLITELPDNSIVEEVRRQESEVEHNFKNWVSSQAVGRYSTN